MHDDEAMIARLRGAGCVFAEEEARLLAGIARTPAELDAMIGQREQGLPLEQILGWAQFCGLTVLVDPGVFVPRRRSEFLVETAVSLVSAARPGACPLTASPLGACSPAASPPGPPGPVIVDLCCGTGALGLGVADGVRLAAGGGTVPGAIAPGRVAAAGGELHAADIDPVAVACARRNVEPAGGRVYCGDLFGALPPDLRGRVDVLICNAPYVPSAEIAFLPVEARDHEPLVALDGGLDGLSVLSRAAAGAPGWLAPGGVLLVETSERQAAGMASVMSAAGLAARVHADDEYGATVITGTAPGRGR